MVGNPINSADRAEQFVPTNHEIDKGLLILLIGYTTLFVSVCIGGVYIWTATDEGARFVYQQFGESAGDVRDCVWGASALAALVAYLLVLVAQAWTLAWAPAYRLARETMFICVTMFLLASVFHGAAFFVGGSYSNLEWQLYLRNFDRYFFARPGFTLQVIGVCITVIWFCCLNHFLRIIGGYFDRLEKTLHVDSCLLYVGALFGGTAGALMFAHRLSFGSYIISALIAGWFGCIVWHLGRISRARFCIFTSATRVQRQMLQQGSWVTMENTPKSLSGMRRVLQNLKK